MPPVGFEPKISAGERLQTYASDRVATGTSSFELFRKKKNTQLVNYVNRHFVPQDKRYPVESPAGNTKCHIFQRYSVDLYTEVIYFNLQYRLLHSQQKSHFVFKTSVVFSLLLYKFDVSARSVTFVLHKQVT
jgi:hypothetical protein